MSGSELRQRKPRAVDESDTKEEGKTLTNNTATKDDKSKPVRKHSRKCICCKWCTLFIVVPMLLFALAFAFIPSVKSGVQLKLMRFFRDVSRARARKNLHGEGSMIPFLMGTDTVMDVMDDGESGVWLTEDELKEFDGKDENTPLYLSIKNRIYDVSEGRDYYGKGRSYHHFVGRDATRAYVTGCTTGSCLVSSIAGLDSMWLSEIDRWVELYEYHDKYRFVGLLKRDPVEAALEEDQVLQQLQDEKLRGNHTAIELIVQGKLAYAKNDDQDAIAHWNAAMIVLGEAQLDDPKTKVTSRAEILNMRAALAQRNKRFGEAVEHYSEAIAGLRRSLGRAEFGRSELAASVISDQGAALFMDPSTRDDAVAKFKAALVIYERIIDGELFDENGENDEEEEEEEKQQQEGKRKSHVVKEATEDDDAEQVKSQEEFNEALRKRLRVTRANTRFNLARALGVMARNSEALEALETLVAEVEEDTKNSNKDKEEVIGTDTEEEQKIPDTLMHLVRAAKQGIDALTKVIEEQKIQEENGAEEQNKF